MLGSNIRRGAMPLVALAGALIGAAEAGFAEDKKPSRAMLGVTLRDDGGHVLVKDVYMGGPAHAAGLRPGDRIVAIDETAVNTSGELIEVLATHQVGDRFELHASRDGWRKELPITMADGDEVSRQPLFLGVVEEAAPFAFRRPVTTRTSGRPNQPHPSPFYRLRYERW